MSRVKGKLASDTISFGLVGSSSISEDQVESSCDTSLRVVELFDGEIFLPELPAEPVLVVSSLSVTPGFFSGSLLAELLLMSLRLFSELSAVSLLPLFVLLPAFEVRLCLLALLPLSLSPLALPSSTFSSWSSTVGMMFMLKLLRRSKMLLRRFMFIFTSAGGCSPSPIRKLLRRLPTKLFRRSPTEPRCAIFMSERSFSVKTMLPRRLSEPLLERLTCSTLERLLDAKASMFGRLALRIKCECRFSEGPGG
mmetsp:Transcript_97528/g.183393  ORF Transcript_97528/g.183393 Transcript_97528/m.183393 type:complete len:252 (-) Transcript_97528:712-1467(-)